jgi:hypothetical protein
MSAACVWYVHCVVLVPFVLCSRSPSLLVVVLLFADLCGIGFQFNVFGLRRICTGTQMAGQHHDTTQ